MKYRVQKSDDNYFANTYFIEYKMNFWPFWCNHGGVVAKRFSSKERAEEEIKELVQLKGKTYTENKPMSKAAIFVLGLLATIMIVGMWFSGNYNSLVTARNQVKLAWAKVETNYQYRFDIIDNLVQSVKASQKQEVDIFTRIADSRKMYAAATNESDKAEAINKMESNIAMLPRLQEAAYPELKSNNNIIALMQDLRNTEGDIKTTRNEYNTTATNYNTNITSFPKNIFANIFGFKEVTLFKSDEAASKAVKVKF